MKARKRLLCAALAPLALFAASAIAQQETFLRIPAEADILRTLRPEHPRVLTTAEMWAQVKAAIGADPRIAPMASPPSRRSGGQITENSASGLPNRDGRGLVPMG